MNQNYKLKIMKLLLLFPILILITTAQIDHTAINPTIVPIHRVPEKREVPKQHSFGEIFNGIGYEISGQVYESNRSLGQSQLYNISNYHISQSCNFYNSDIRLQPLNSYQLDSDISIQTSFISQSKRKIFLLLSNNNYLNQQHQLNKVIVIVNFKTDSYQKQTDNITISSLGLNSSDAIDISMMEIKNVLFVTDGVKLVGIDIGNVSRWWKIPISSMVNQTVIDYNYASQKELLKFQMVKYDPTSQTITFMMAWNSIIKLYQISSDSTKASLLRQINPPPTKLFYDIYFQLTIQCQKIYGLVDQQLVIYRLNNQNNSYTTIELQSKQCEQFNKYQSTIHLICKEGGLKYVGEFLYKIDALKNQDKLYLNRYYTQVDDANLLFRFGDWDNPKLFISGDEQLILTAYGINRKVLLQSPYQQMIKRYRSLGIQNIKSIQQFSSFNSTFAVGVGTSFLTFFRLNQYPATIQCYNLKNNGLANWQVLVQINTTSCFQNGDIQQLQSICQISIPFQFSLKSFQVDSSKKTTVSLAIFLIFAVIIFLLLGFVFHCKTLRQRATAEIKKKLQKLKKNKEMKPI